MGTRIQVVGAAAGVGAIFGAILSAGSTFMVFGLPVGVAVGIGVGGVAALYAMFTR